MATRERMEVANITNFLETEQIPSDTESIDGVEDDIGQNVPHLTNIYLDDNCDLFRDMYSPRDVEEDETLPFSSSLPSTFTSTAANQEPQVEPLTSQQPIIITITQTQEPRAEPENLQPKIKAGA
ncbi:hypothetical protein J6590_063203 [Homalodisca vitripennis]|nr:hypothetical protein J6590_063201 [Homalodisca vitripennis]KAG8315854.1 hypothetical protein J6590_063203 [Homalodisca vitripennis]